MLSLSFVFSLFNVSNAALLEPLLSQWGNHDKKLFNLIPKLKPDPLLYPSKKQPQ
ncbi:exported protein of unknown function [Xenorhabdus poinarii G6]|uniref:Uncharacterized protein n=1 Tax=Xenorhabdus poinarii G6 TaxID=1354304 RepID=A0A068R3T9_9GAMM|nr:exported protein of unknown function [Xenorhabdus poinarii G6]